VLKDEALKNIELLQKSVKNDENEFKLRTNIYILCELSNIASENIPNDQITTDLKLKCEKYQEFINN
jgi:hypothetical protein